MTDLSFLKVKQSILDILRSDDVPRSRDELKRAIEVQHRTKTVSDATFNRALTTLLAERKIIKRDTMFHCFP